MAQDGKDFCSLSSPELNSGCGVRLAVNSGRKGGEFSSDDLDSERRLVMAVQRELGLLRDIAEELGILSNVINLHGPRRRPSSLSLGEINGLVSQPISTIKESANLVAVKEKLENLSRSLIGAIEPVLRDMDDLPDGLRENVLRCMKSGYFGWSGNIRCLSEAARALEEAKEEAA